MLKPLWKTVWQFLKKLNAELPYYPTIPLLGMYPRELKHLFQKKKKKKYPPMFMEALLIIVKEVETTQRSIKPKWINEVWYVHAMEYYSVIKAIKDIVYTWINFENVMLSECSQMLKVTYYMVPFI